MEPRLTAEFWVKAQIRQCFANDIPAFVARRGDSHAGTILIKLNRFSVGVTVLAPIASMDGRRAWMRATGDESVSDAEAEAIIAKRLKSDPDIWVLEIEDQDGRWEPDAPII